MSESDHKTKMLLAAFALLIIMAVFVGLALSVLSVLE